MVLVLAVNPGWGGQKFIASTCERVKRLRERLGDTALICVDGGVTRDNIENIGRMGADIIVTGSAVFDGKAPLRECQAHDGRVAMNSHWNDQDAARFQGLLGQRVYTSRLLGRDPSLVLHGGGNTSVKLAEPNVCLASPRKCCTSKGAAPISATIDAKGFSPCRLRRLLQLVGLSELSDEQMESELKLSLTRASALAPSVETLLHALLPQKYVDHTHADALIAVMNSRNGFERLQEIYGTQVVIIPYAMPGFKLVRLCREILSQEATRETVGVVLMHHGLFTFGETAKVSYERMIDLVSQAERYLETQGARSVEWLSSNRQPPAAHGACDAAPGSQPGGRCAHGDDRAQRFAGAGLCPASRCRRVVATGRSDARSCRSARSACRWSVAMSRHAAAYQDYVRAYVGWTHTGAVDPAPRVILDPELGMAVLGRSAEDASIAEDIYRHTIDIIMGAEKLGGWKALPARDFFDVEFWDLERTKLAKPDPEPIFLGEVALGNGRGFRYRQSLCRCVAGAGRGGRRSGCGARN